MKITATLGAAHIRGGIVLHPREQLRQLRSKIADAAERLIAVLDWIDGDPDMEPDLSQTTGSSAFESQALAWRKPAAEGDSSEDLEHSGDEFEPSIGSNDRLINQQYWSAIAPRSAEDADLEEACDDEGIDSDSEPDHLADSGECGSAPFAMDQSGDQWATGDRQPVAAE
jgi:hypothetical protein